MILCIDNVLTTDELKQVHDILADAEFVDGKLTVGTYAKVVKENYQLKGDTEAANQARVIIDQALQRNSLFQATIRPKSVRPFLFSRYEAGMFYGIHTDNALMGDDILTRSDVSITLFLSAPNTYKGGELVIDTSLGEQFFKLSAGSMIVYPSIFLHRVAEVTEGVRLAAVSWVQSIIRDPYEREMLFELDTVRRSIFEKYGKTIEFDLLCKLHANLLRKWAEV
ncbi:Fe2+-dependent dioxygenase [Thermosynechococcaceae cyanobacterium Okahandja]